MEAPAVAAINGGGYRRQGRGPLMWTEGASLASSPTTENGWREARTFR